jgi:hypothetical protein
MKKQFILTSTEMKNIKGGKGRGNAKNVFPELPAEGDEGLTNVPELPEAQKGKGKRPF